MVELDTREPRSELELERRRLRLELVTIGIEQLEQCRFAAAISGFGDARELARTADRLFAECEGCPAQLARLGPHAAELGLPPVEPQSMFRAREGGFGARALLCRLPAIEDRDGN